VSCTHINTLELLSIQNQLLLAIGGSLNSREILHSFMHCALKTLVLDSIHLYTHDDPALSDTGQKTHQLSLPDDKAISENASVIQHILNDYENTETNSHTTVKLDGFEILAFSFGNAGVLLLEKRQDSFQESIKDALLPVVLKLADHYQLCEQQKFLRDEIQINKHAQRTYELQAKRDPLTNLPNRREFRHALFREISNTQRYNYYGALMYIDLDNFKNVNDSLGHSIGDILLTQVAKRLLEQARQEDNVFRLGGDEFVYILSNIGNNPNDAVNTSSKVAHRVIETLARPIEIGEYSLHITPSIGIAIFPDAYDEQADSENVLRHADTAMYHAKKQGKNCYAFFNPEMHVEASKRLIIEDHLRKAIKNNELALQYQPIVNTSDKIVGAEALVRWKNPVLGNISPDIFIEIAEESNLILELSKWIMENACAYAEKLHSALPENSLFSYISINISPRQFIQNNFVELILSAINSFNVPNEFIKLEFTENVLLDNFDRTIEKMKSLHGNNIDFLLDDFGTGYSSLAYLHKLPIKLLKIDKSFITDFYSQGKDTQAIVNAIMVMTEQLGIQCIVEGVEKQQHVDYFKHKGVHGMQGFFFYKPMTGEKLFQLLSN
jgi:diguanylate cyclase (GGDEF)-like protein